MLGTHIFMNKYQARQRGSILPLTLIILAILTALAVSLSQQARSTLKDMEQLQQQWNNELIYRSVLQQLIQALLLGKSSYNEVVFDGKRIPIDGEFITIDGVDVSVQDSAGLLGLGYYHPDRVFNLLKQATDKKTALHIRDELADWIDADNIKQRYGMEANDYQMAGKKYQPRNAPLRHLDELLELPSMTPVIYNKQIGKYRLREHLLVGGNGYLNAATASETVLKATLSLSDNQVSTIIRARELRQWSKVERLLPKIGEIFDDFGPFVRSNVYRIKIKKKNAAPLSVIIRLTHFYATPYKIQLWHYPDNERGWTQ